MRSNWGIFRSVAVLTVAGLQLSACGANDVVCPAVGWISTISVRLEGDLTAVDDVELCTPEGCSVPDVAAPQPASPKSAVPSPPVASSPSTAPFAATRTAANSWSFTVRGHLPGDVETRVLGPGGALLAQQQYQLEWTRSGGSDECGGPMTTQPIIIRLPGSRQ